MEKFDIDLIDRYPIFNQSLEGQVMDINYMLKVQDSKAVDIQKALKAAGIAVTSIIEVHKDKVEEKAS